MSFLYVPGIVLGVTLVVTIPVMSCNSVLYKGVTLVVTIPVTPEV